MDRMFCPECSLEQPTVHRFCVRCGHDLPAHLLIDQPAKTVRFFAGTKVAGTDPDLAFLRVSCYRDEQVLKSHDGTVVIPGHHVRFSVWVEDSARCVISLPESEAVELVRFMSSELKESIPA